MQLLFLSNYYPPFARGGYEQWCQEVAGALTARGHRVDVLTSCGPDGAGIDDGDVSVHRLLNLEVEGGLHETVVRLLRDRDRLEEENLTHVRRLIATLTPDAALIWGMWNVPRSVPALVERLLADRVAYYFCDYWPSLPSAYLQRWQEPARSAITRLPKQILSSLFLPRHERESAIELELRHPICVSYAVRDRLVDAGVDVAHAQVVHGGTQVDQFSFVNRFNRDGSKPLKLVYVGRLVADKGVHTILNAMRLLAREDECLATLDIFGAGNPDYEAALRRQVQRDGLQSVVTFRSRVPRTEIPQVYAEHDALVFASEWDEPFARTVLEAMAAGLLVIGTTTGGTGEVLLEDETGLTFPAGDAAALAAQIRRVARDVALHARLAMAGRRRVLHTFTFSNMVDQLEGALEQRTRAATPSIHDKALVG